MSSDEKTELYKRLSQIDSRVDRVLFILESDSRTNTQGLVEEVRMLREKVSQLEVDKKVKNAQIATWGAIGSAVVMALAFLFKQFLSFILK